MKNQEIRQLVEELQNLYAQAELTKNAILSRESLIKNELDAREVETLDLGTSIIRFTNVLSNRFDTSKFKKMHKDLYLTFLKQVQTRRFSIA